MDFNFNLKKDIIWKKGWKDLPEAYVKIKVPSVTGIINELVPDPGLEKWIQEVGKETADKITQAAWDRGTAMHTYIEQFFINFKSSKDISKALKYTQINSLKILNKLGIPDNKIEKGRNLFYNFYDSNFLKLFLDFQKIEHNVYSPYCFYRGKIDIIYKMINGIAVSDFKTSNKQIEKGSVKEKKYKLQLGAYALALEHMFKQIDKKINITDSSILVMHTKSSNIFKVDCKNEELQKNKKDFENLVKEWHKNYNKRILK